MSFEVRTIAVFDRNAKRLAKKYRSLKKDLAEMVASLAEDPKQGTAIGGGCYKLRLSVGSKGKGKSGGTRVITYVAVVDGLVYMLTIYDKSEQESISKQELMMLRKMIP
jgi:hypothetical protein